MLLTSSGNPFKCDEEVLYLQSMIPPKRFDIISPPDWGMLRRSGCVQIFHLNNKIHGIPSAFRNVVHIYVPSTVIGSVPIIVYRVTPLRTDVVHCRESAGTGPIVLKVVRLTGTSFLCVTLGPISLRLSFSAPLLGCTGHVRYRKYRRILHSYAYPSRNDDEK